MTSGIVSYGSYIPKYRVKRTDIAKAWMRPEESSESLCLTEKAVAGFDEDAVTMALEASLEAIAMGDLLPTHIESVFFGSESHPYAVTPSSTILAESLGVGNNYFAVDMEFACKAATAGMQITLSMAEAQKVTYGLVIGSDAAQARPRDILEYTAASAACAFLIGTNPKEILANVLDFSSFSSYTPDFWRRDGVRFPSHYGRFTGGPAYFTHVLSEAKQLLDKSGTQPSDYDYCVFHMPNGKFPRTVAKKLGFTDAQLKPSLTVDAIGNPYTASALLGLTAVLSVAKPNQKIFFVSYGSGAGSDGFLFETTEVLAHKQKRALSFAEKIKNTTVISYIDYLTKTHNI